MGVLHRVLGFSWNLLEVVIIFIVNLVMVYPIVNLIHYFLPDFVYQYPAVHAFMWYVFTAVGYLGLPMTMVNADFFISISSMLIMGVLVGFVFPVVPGLKHVLAYVRGERPLTAEQEEKMAQVMAYMEKKAGKSVGKWTIVSCLPGRGFNAACSGHRHIMVTPEAIQEFYVSELAGLMAHEMGHYVHGDTRGLGMAFGFTLVGNFCIFLLNMVVWVTGILAIIPILGILFWLTSLLFTWFARLYTLFRYIPTWCDLFIQRRKEYLADAYGLELNLGPEVIEVLEVLYETYGDCSWWATLTIDHPRLQSRIAAMKDLVSYYADTDADEYQVAPVVESSDTQPAMAALSVATGAAMRTENPATRGNRW